MTTLTTDFENTINNNIYKCYYLNPEDVREINTKLLELNHSKVLFTDAYRIYIKEEDQKKKKEINEALNQLLKDIDVLEASLMIQFKEAALKVLPEGENLDDYDFDIYKACFYKRKEEEE